MTSENAPTDPKPPLAGRVAGRHDRSVRRGRHVIGSILYPPRCRSQRILAGNEAFFPVNGNWNGYRLGAGLAFTGAVTGARRGVTGSLSAVQLDCR